MSERTEEAQGALNATGEGQAAANIGAAASAKKTERRTPKKLGSKKPTQQPTPDASPDPAGDISEADHEMIEPPSPQTPREMSRRRQSRGRGRRGAQESDVESIARSDISTAGGGRRNRQRNKQKTATKEQGGEDSLLGGIGEGLPGGELVGGATDMVQNTAGNAVNQVGNTAGKALGGLTGGKKEDDGEKEQLRLRLELNLDIEIQLKAKIHGDLTLGLL
jgi:hypothetical protein